MNKYKIKLTINVFLFILTLGILVYFCVHENNLLTLINIAPSLNYFWVVFGVAVMALSWILDSLVIKLIIKDVLRTERYSNFLSLKTTMIGQFFGAITPLGVAGQPMQVIELTNQKIQSGKAISILVRKFLVYQSTTAVYSLIVILFKTNLFIKDVNNFVFITWIGFLCQCFSVILLLFFYINKSFTMKALEFFINSMARVRFIKNPKQAISKLKTQFDLFVQNNKSMQDNIGLTIKLYFLTFLQMTCLFAVPFFVYKGFNAPGYPFVDMLSAQSFVTVISSYTPLPGSAGTTEGMFLILFGKFFSPDILMPAMIVCRVITYYLNIIVGFFVTKIKSSVL